MFLSDAVMGYVFIPHRNLVVQEMVGAALQLPHSAFIHTALQTHCGQVSNLSLCCLNLHLFLNSTNLKSLRLKARRNTGNKRRFSNWHVHRHLVDKYGQYTFAYSKHFFELPIILTLKKIRIPQTRRPQKRY